MEISPYFTKVKNFAVSSIKTIWIFGSIAMAAWIFLLTLWINGVYQYDWDVFDSVSVFTICAVVYLLMTTLGTIGMILILVMLNKKTSSPFINLIGVVFAIPVVELSIFIIWLIFYSKDGVYESAGELSSNILFAIPNIISFLLLVYIGWKINESLISETVLPTKE
jgi:hypothetical protein